MVFFLEKCPNSTFNFYHGFEGFTLLGLGTVITCKKARDSFASSMMKEDNRVGSCMGDHYLIPEH